VHRAIIILTGLAILAAVNYSIWQKEKLLSDGQIALLELAPVDPRSLMQGDYMALRFALERDAGNIGRDAHLVVGLDENRVARFRRVDDGRPLAPDEMRIFARYRDSGLKVGTNAFFFQEGDAALYESAKYGEARVDGQGQLLLTGLRDKDFKHLGR